MFINRGDMYNIIKKKVQLGCFISNTSTENEGFITNNFFLMTFYYA